MKKLAWGILGMACGLVSPSIAATTIPASSCAQDAVISAIATAQDGDTVQVPAGNCTWTTVLLHTPTISLIKAITLKGAGVDQTIINDGTGTGASEDPIDMGSGARVTGFTFSDSRVATDYKSVISASGTNWRVDHNKFSPWTNGGQGVAASGAGVIDHNTFYDRNHAINIYGNGDTSWSSPSPLGTANAVFIEDNTFIFTAMNDGVTDAYDGAVYVFRHNSVVGSNIQHHGFDSGGYRAPYSFEIYSNTFDNPNAALFTTMNFRGGSGVIFSNTITAAGGSYNSFAILRNYRSDDDYTSADGNSWDTCNGSSSFDGNTPGGQGYPCRDQIGRGPNQTLSPLYLWNNSYKGGAAIPSVAGYDSVSVRASTYHILENRDFYSNTPKPGYTPYTYPHPLVAADPGPKTYYVAANDANANDATNPGTLTLPFKTIQHAATLVNPGDTVLVRAGTYDGFLINRSGTAGSLITFKNYPGEIPVILGNYNGNGITMTTGQSPFVPMGYLIIDGFEFTDAPTSANIDMSAVQYVTIRNCEFHTNTLNPIYIAAGSHITIDKNKFHDWGTLGTDRWHGHGIYATGRHYTITNNIFYNGGCYAIQPAAYYQGSTQCSWCGNIPAGFDSVDDWTISNNVMSGQKCDAGMVVWDGGNGGTGGNVSNVRIVNNIFYGNGAGIKFYKDGSTGLMSQGLTVDDNLYLNLNNAPQFILNNAGATLTTSTNRMSDPLFVNPSLYDFHLKSGSPAIDAGAALASVTWDLDGVSRPMGPAIDIGAYEFCPSGNCGGGAATPTPTPTPPSNTAETQFLPFKNVFNPIQGNLIVNFKVVGGPATLLVYDRSGADVRTLDASNGKSATWDGRNDSNSLVASGTYILVLKQNGKVVKTKVVVVK